VIDNITELVMPFRKSSGNEEPLIQLRNIAWRTLSTHYRHAIVLPHMEFWSNLFLTIRFGMQHLQLQVQSLRKPVLESVQSHAG
jgi:hypothetical protein